MKTVPAAFALLGLFVLASCGGDDPPPMTPIPPPTTGPVIATISASVMNPGDTLNLGGSNFSTVASDNRVIFNNDLAQAIPFFATADSLRVVVPIWANSGGLFVTTQGVASAAVNVEIQRAVGEPWAIAGGTAFDFKLASPTGGERYVVIPLSASAGGQANFSYTITPSATGTFPAPPRTGSGRGGTRSFPLEFERNIRQQTIDYIKNNGDRRRPFEKATARKTPPATVNFLVLNCTSCSTADPGSYTTISADLKFLGRRAAVYADVNQPTGSFTQADYDAFGMQFDSQIFPTDSMFFAEPTDIDNDSHVAILFTPEVNLLTPAGTAQTQGFISGFFLFNDLVPGLVPAGTSNGMEVFYSMVPDPNSEFGNTFAKGFITGIIPGTLAHELEHMISIGFRFFNFGINSLQVTWLEEGMAHMAEDLNGFDASNKARADLYLADPGNVGLIDPNSDTLEQRGGSYLLLRYLGDQAGEGIYAFILKDSCVDLTCIELASGVNFFTFLVDYMATLFLSDRGITANTKYNFSSFDLQQDFAALRVTARTIGGGTIAGNVRNAGGDFFSMSGFQSPAAQFDVTNQAGSEIRVIAVQTQ